MIDVDEVVEVSKLSKRSIVYNLTVDDQHEYFANGILVSNCDALRYGLIWLFPNQAWSSFSTDAYGGKEEDDYAKPYTAGLYDKTF